MNPPIRPMLRLPCYLLAFVGLCLYLVGLYNLHFDSMGLILMIPLLPLLPYHALYLDKVLKEAKR